MSRRIRSSFAALIRGGSRGVRFQRSILHICHSVRRRQIRGVPILDAAQYFQSAAARVEISQRANTRREPRSIDAAPSGIPLCRATTLAVCRVIEIVAKFFLQNIRGHTSSRSRQLIRPSRKINRCTSDASVRKFLDGFPRDFAVQWCAELAAVDSSHFSQSMAAAHPDPAAVIAWR